MMGGKPENQDRTHHQQLLGMQADLFISYEVKVGRCAIRQTLSQLVKPSKANTKYNDDTLRCVRDYNV